jgi:lysophospholipase L1-like esterase
MGLFGWPEALLFLPPAAGPSPLLTKLQRGEAWTLVALGDSITYGFGLDDPSQDTYYQIFATALRQAYRHSWLRVINSGVNGDSSAQGLARLERDVLAYQPDLVTLLFGGNDYQQKRLPADLQKNLRSLIRGIRTGSKAEIILLTPPWEGQEADTPYVQAVRGVAQAEGVALADFDAALRETERDSRGLFAYKWDHPRKYSHAVMGRELLRAFQELCGQPATLSLELAETVRTVPLGQRLEVPLSLRQQAGPKGSATVHVNHGWPLLDRTVEIPPDGHCRLSLFLPLPHYLVHNRTQQCRLFATARAGDAVACAVRWLTLAPIVACEAARGPVFVEDDPAAVPVARSLEAVALVAGAEQWRGPQDLKAVFRAAADDENFYLSVRVWDDVLSLQKNVAPFDNDGIEVFLDLRPLPHQGKPFFDENVLLLYVNPGNAQTRWQTLEAAPDDLRQVSVASFLQPDGYLVDLAVPLAFIQKRTGEPLDSIGFDLAIDDADWTGHRETQMMWAGRADNYLDPSQFGALSFHPVPDHAVRVTVH